MSDLAVSSIPDKAPPYSVSYTVRVTEAMDDHLTQILAKQKRGITRNDLVRTAIRQYIDDQEDVIGSRRNFNKSLQQHIDKTDRHLLFYLNVILYLLASSLAVILQAVTRDDTIKADALIRDAIAETIKSGPTLNEKIQKVRERYESQVDA